MNNTTDMDPSIMCGLFWPLEHDGPLEILASGVADSPAARHLQSLFASHENARQPPAARLAGYRSIARLVLQKLFDPCDAAARERRAVLASALELGDFDQAKVFALQDRMCECPDWGDFSETRAADVVLNAIDALPHEREHARHGIDSWCKATELLAALAELVPPADLEAVMQQAAELAYVHLFAR